MCGHIRCFGVLLLFGYVDLDLDDGGNAMSKRCCLPGEHCDMHYGKSRLRPSAMGFVISYGLKLPHSSSHTVRQFNGAVVQMRLDMSPRKNVLLLLSFQSLSSQ